MFFYFLIIPGIIMAGFMGYSVKKHEWRDKAIFRFRHFNRVAGDMSRKEFWLNIFENRFGRN